MTRKRKRGERRGGRGRRGRVSFLFLAPCSLHNCFQRKSFFRSLFCSERNKNTPHVVQRGPAAPGCARRGHGGQARLPARRCHQRRHSRGIGPQSLFRRRRLALPLGAPRLRRRGGPRLGRRLGRRDGQGHPGEEIETERTGGARDASGRRSKGKQNEKQATIGKKGCIGCFRHFFCVPFFDAKSTVPSSSIDAKTRSRSIVVAWRGVGTYSNASRPLNSLCFFLARKAPGAAAMKKKKRGTTRPIVKRLKEKRASIVPRSLELPLPSSRLAVEHLKTKIAGRGARRGDEPKKDKAES